MKHKIFQILPAALLAGALQAAGPWETFSLFASGEARAAVQEAMKATGATAVSVALVDGDRFVWTEPFGIKDVIGGRPISASEETMFGLGPASKLMTAIAVMKLVEQGAVKLDDPVARHLPDFRMRSPEARDITVRMLLCHASGLPGTDPGNLHTTLPFPGYPKQVLATLETQYLKHAPGYLHAYGHGCCASPVSPGAIRATCGWCPGTGSCGCAAAAGCSVPWRRSRRRRWRSSPCPDPVPDRYFRVEVPWPSA